MREPVGEPTHLAVTAGGEQAQVGTGEEAGKSLHKTSILSAPRRRQGRHREVEHVHHHSAH